jgi:D-threo-aldose 1-dehydrogenase
MIIHSPLPGIGLGCATFGATSQNISDADAIGMIQHAWGRGVRLFDTAALYGGGLSERRLGLALQGMPRSDWILSTKLGRYRAEGDLPPREGGGGDRWDFSGDGTRRAIEDSLKRLGTDYLDIVHLHDCDNYLPQVYSGALPALIQLREEGVIGRIGAGCNAVAPILELVRGGHVDAVLIAGRYTLLDHSAGENLIPECAARGVTVLVGGVFNSGALASPSLDDATYDYLPLTPEMRAHVLRMRAICAAWKVDPIAAAVQFPRRFLVSATVLLGVDSIAQLDKNLAAFDTPIPEGFWKDAVLAP